MASEKEQLLKLMDVQLVPQATSVHRVLNTLCFHLARLELTARLDPIRWLAHPAQHDLSYLAKLSVIAALVALVLPVAQVTPLEVPLAS